MKHQALGHITQNGSWTSAWTPTGSCRNFQKSRGQKDRIPGLNWSLILASLTAEARGERSGRVGKDVTIVTMEAVVWMPMLGQAETCATSCRRGGTEAQRRKVTHPRPPTEEAGELGFEPSSVWIQSPFPLLGPLFLSAKWAIYFIADSPTRHSVL